MMLGIMCSDRTGWIWLVQSGSRSRRNFKSAIDGSKNDGARCLSSVAAWADTPIHQLPKNLLFKLMHAFADRMRTAQQRILKWSKKLFPEALDLDHYTPESLVTL